MSIHNSSDHKFTINMQLLLQHRFENVSMVYFSQRFELTFFTWRAHSKLYNP